MKKRRANAHIVQVKSHERDPKNFGTSEKVKGAPLRTIQRG